MCDPTIQQPGFELLRQQWSLLNRFRTEHDTAVPAEGNGDLQTLICVLAARLRQCPTLSNPVLWQSWMAAIFYLCRWKNTYSECYFTPVPSMQCHWMPRNILKAKMWKLALTCTPGPILPTKWGPDPNSTMTQTINDDNTVHLCGLHIMPNISKKRKYSTNSQGWYLVWKNYHIKKDWSSWVFRHWRKEEIEQIYWKCLNCWLESLVQNLNHSLKEVLCQLQEVTQSNLSSTVVNWTFGSISSVKEWSTVGTNYVKTVFPVSL